MIFLLQTGHETPVALQCVASTVFGPQGSFALWLQTLVVDTRVPILISTRLKSCVLLSGQLAQDASGIAVPHQVVGSIPTAIFFDYYIFFTSKLHRDNSTKDKRDNLVCRFSFTALVQMFSAKCWDFYLLIFHFEFVNYFCTKTSSPHIPLFIHRCFCWHPHTHIFPLT